MTGLFSTGLNYGGAVAVSFGWPLVCTMSFIVALSMAEICSGAPTRVSSLPVTLEALANRTCKTVVPATMPTSNKHRLQVTRVGVTEPLL